jgi:hypothetical protein
MNQKEKKHKRDHTIILHLIANKKAETMNFLKVIFQKFKNNLDIKIFGTKKNHQLIVGLIKFKDKLIILSKVRIILNLSVILHFIIIYLLMILNLILNHK